MNCIILDNIETKFEVIALTEAWLGLENISINNFAINGYTTYSTTNNTNHNDGVVVYLKDTLSDIIVTKTNTQALTAVKISFKMSNIDFLIYVIYRSPNSYTDVTLLELNDIILLNSALKTAIVHATKTGRLPPKPARQERAVSRGFSNYASPLRCYTIGARGVFVMRC